MKIAIAGYGIEGESNYRYWSRDASNELTIVDHKQVPDRALPEGVPTILGPDAFEKLEGFDMVIRTAGLAPNAIKTDGKIWSSTNEFFEKCPVDIIGVTGTKGKGTTSSLITSILKASGRNVWLVGNVGQAPLDILDQISDGDIVVYELSSFQLWDIERSPKLAVVLFIEQEHLDIHDDLSDYLGAKANITKYQTEQNSVIFYSQNDYATSIAEASKGRKIGFPDEATAHVKEGNFYYNEQLICSTKELNLKGEHNLINTVAAIDTAWEYTQDTAAITSGISSFKGLPHRLALVKTVDGVDYYDDSIATTPSAAIAALKAFNEPKVIILGGSSKGSDFSELAEELTKHDVQAVLIGQEAETIATALRAVGFDRFEIIENANAEAFTRRAAELAKPGSVVLLSPAAASFGLFKDYADRGDQFIQSVNRL